MPVPSALTLQKFKFTSDYPVDKVIYRHTDTQTVPHAPTASDSVTYTYAHGLGFRPLVRGIYSDDGFSTYYEFGNDPYFFDTTFMTYSQRISATAYADATNVYVTVINWDTTRSMSWKVIGLYPADGGTLAAPTNTGGDSKFLFNSDYNYLKLIDDSVTTLTTSGAGFQNVTVTHSLGYAPMFMAWTEFGGYTRPVGTENAVGVTSVGANAYATTTQAVVELETYIPVAMKVHFKVYADA